MSRPFADRAEAGRVLAEKLAAYRADRDVIVLGLPRGGVPVAYEVARPWARRWTFSWCGSWAHRARKSSPWEPSPRAMSSSSMTRWSTRSRSPPELKAEVDNERRELSGATRFITAVALRRGQGKTVILVDDGLATGSTMRAAVAALATASRHKSSSPFRSARLDV